MSAVHSNEHNAAAAFTGQAPIFDELYSSDTIINYKRARVRRHILKHLAAGSSVLELNCGERL